ncbi:MAG: glutamine-synthetase adenylyltransferase [Gluconacetobacter diazotrophicus]|nr:glutamine-synthetase adenylyltransferase [Gluconacetobacter diazotrophicus]
MDGGFRLPDNWPAAADTAAGERLVADLRAEGGRGWRDACRRPEVGAMLRCFGGNGSHLGALARREPAFLLGLVRHGPDRAVGAAMRDLRALAADGVGRDAVAAGLRTAKRRVALGCAAADLCGLWELEKVCGTLSLLAEASLRIGVAHLLRTEAVAKRIALPFRRDPERGSGFCVLAMGKLGAGELNYSSDIDLVMLFDPDAQPDLEEPGRLFVRLAGALAGLMEARDAGGYVFRVDLRLRPDPGATPIAVSVAAATTYYESYGRTWERAAMIKARPVAGDLALGTRFLLAIRPFVWRRGLDFAAIADMREMKARIDRRGSRAAGGWGAKPGPGPAGPADAANVDPVAALLGHDLKLGRGGIREIEFVAQALLLAWAGRVAALREPGTVAALRGLAAAGVLSAAGADTLVRAYRRLRELEHRLQMLDDRQTHALPDTRTGFERFAGFAGAADTDAMARGVLALSRRVRRRFEHMLRPGNGEGSPGAAGGTVETEPGAVSLPDGTVAAFGSEAAVRAVLERWGSGQYRALRDGRARFLLAELTPRILRAAAAQRDPAGTLGRFDALLARQQAGLGLLALLRRHPELVDRIGGALGAAPALADQLVAVPGALDGLLLPDRGEARAGMALRAMLGRQMREAGDPEAAIRDARALVRGEEFRLGLAVLEGRLDAETAGKERTALAERVVCEVLLLVEREHRLRHGTVRGGGMCVVLLGKGGSRGMMSGSDLDLMLVYDHPDGEADSRVGPRSGGRALPASQYFTRLAHRLVAMLTMPGAEGPLYALDMRLRPSGNKGPVAVSLAAFERYHATESWTWERMALCRARVVAGPAALRRRVGEAIDAALDGAVRGAAERGRGGAAALRRDAAAMRGRLARELPGTGRWDVKLRPGGLMELEFVVQVAQLLARNRAARSPETAVALRRLRRTGALSATDAAALLDADRFWRRLQGGMRLLLGVGVPTDLAALPEAVRDGLRRMTGMAPGAEDPGLAGLAARCEEVADTVRAVFGRVVGPIPADAGSPAGMRTRR